MKFVMVRIIVQYHRRVGVGGERSAAVYAISKGPGIGDPAARAGGGRQRDGCAKIRRAIVKCGQPGDGLVHGSTGRLVVGKTLHGAPSFSARAIICILLTKEVSIGRYISTPPVSPSANCQLADGFSCHALVSQAQGVPLVGLLMRIA